MALMKQPKKAGFAKPISMSANGNCCMVTPAARRCCRRRRATVLPISLNPSAQEWNLKMGRKNFRFYACMIGAALGLLSAMDFRTQTSGTITVPVKVEDKDAYFLVDTGGSTSTIDPFMANKFQ